MNRIILLISFCFFGTSIASAQKFHFGLKASPNLSWFSSSSKGFSTSGSKVGFSYGIVTEFGFTDAENYAFATGLEFNSRGATLTDNTVPAIPVENEIKLQYLDIPLTLKMKTAAKGKIKYFAQVGFVPGFNIKARTTTTTPTTSEEDDFSSSINLFDLSFLIGGGLEYNLGGTTAGFVSLTFNNGFLDITDKDYSVADKSSSVKATNKVVTLNIGILF